MADNDTQNHAKNAKRERSIDEGTDAIEPPKKQSRTTQGSSHHTVSIEQGYGSTVAADIPRWSTEQAHTNIRIRYSESSVSPPLHTEEEYSVMRRDSASSFDFDFSEELGTPHSTQGNGLDFKAPSNEVPPVLRFIAAIRGDFTYSPLPDNYVRLLRLAPGSWEDPVHCALKPISLRSLEREKIGFQALSYAWGTDAPTSTVFLQDVSTNIEDPVPEDLFETVANRTRPRKFLIRKNLHHALKRYRHQKENKWFWIDALCIDQSNSAEKSCQISYMPAIYSSAYNVAIWLGEAEGDEPSASLAVALVPKILNLRAFHTMLSSQRPSDEVLRSWVAFSSILQRAWFRRRWVIQEVSCAKRLSLRISDDILNWSDFADAVELFFDNLERIRELYSESELVQYDPDALNGITSSGVMSIIEFSRNAFRKTTDSSLHVKLMDLETLVLESAAFAVTEFRDVIYALLHLANDAAAWRIYADYTRSLLDVYADFVDYCLLKEGSLDIICRTWAYWPTAGQHDVPTLSCPSWVGLARNSAYGPPVGSNGRIKGQSLVGKPSEKIYDASRRASMQAKLVYQQDEGVPKFSGLLVAKGIKLGRLSAVSSRVIEGTIAEDGLRILGWKGSLEHGVPEQLWRTLVANRGPHGKAAPSWYRRACALALTKASAEGDLSTSKLLANKMQPTTVIDFLKRVQAVVWSRRFFCCTSETETVGFGPRTIMEGDVVCILFGCSVPVILRRVQEPSGETYRLVGECYVHGHMDGEVLVGMAQGAIDFQIV